MILPKMASLRAISLTRASSFSITTTSFPPRAVTRHAAIARRGFATARDATTTTAGRTRDYFTALALGTGVCAALMYSGLAPHHAEERASKCEDPHSRLRHVQLAQENKRRFSFAADAVELASPSLVHIAVQRSVSFLGNIGMSGGSGFLVFDGGFIATNAHVIAPATAGQVQENSVNSKVTVTLSNGKEIDGVVWAYDLASDLALVKIEPPEGLPPATIGSSASLRAGEWVVALGAPLNLQNSVTVGVVSSIARHADDLGMGVKPYDFIQTDASINSGNSGGMLVDLTGAVVGINTMKAGGFSLEGISFAIPIDVAIQILEQLKEHRRVRRPYLGLRMVTLDENVIEVERRFNGNTKIATNVGILVVAVEPESPAGRSRAIKPGDVITKINDKVVRTAGEVIREIGYEASRKLCFELVHSDGSTGSVCIQPQERN